MPGIMGVGRAMEVTHRKCVVFRWTLSHTAPEEGEEQAGYREVTRSWRAGVQGGAEGTLDCQESFGGRTTPKLWLRWESSPGLSFPFCIRGRVTLSTCHRVEQ